MPRAVLGLGGNLGARRAILRAAVALLDAQPGLSVLGRSLVYENPPLGPPQPDYLNAAVLVSWPGHVQGLFEVTRHVELLLGRERRERWGARTLDLDLLLWSGGAVHTPFLDIPHPGTFDRSFVVAPLRDLLPRLAPELEARLGQLTERGAARLQGRDELTAPVAERVEGTTLSELLCDVVAVYCAGANVRTTLPFAVPNTLEAGLSTVIERIHGLAAAGFRVARAAVTHEDAATLRGVFLGQATGSAVPLAPAPAHAGSDGARMWVRIARARS